LRGNALDLLETGSDDKRIVVRQNVRDQQFRSRHVAGFAYLPAGFGQCAWGEVQRKQGFHEEMVPQAEGLPFQLQQEEHIRQAGAGGVFPDQFAQVRAGIDQRFAQGIQVASSIFHRESSGAARVAPIG
jgi:hypothetical protein